MKENAKKHLHLWLPTILFTVALCTVAFNTERALIIWDGFLRILSPLLIGTGIVLILNVPLRGFELLFVKLDRRGRVSEKARHSVSLTLVFVLTPLLLAGIIYFFAPQFASAVANLIDLISNNRETILRFTGRFGFGNDVVESKIQEVTGWISENLGNIAGVMFNTALSIVSSVTSAVMSLMLAVYLLIDKKRICAAGKRMAKAFLPEKAASFLTRVTQIFVNTFTRFLSRQLLEALVLGIILFIAMSIFGIPYALSICCFTVVLALVPYIGALLSLVVGVLMILLIEPEKALMFVILFLVIQQIEENFIYPHLVGESVGLPAYLTLLAVAMGGEIMGIPGMLLFVPIVSVVYTLVCESVDRRVPKDAE